MPFKKKKKKRSHNYVFKEIMKNKIAKRMEQSEWDNIFEFEQIPNESNTTLFNILLLEKQKIFQTSKAISKREEKFIFSK